MNADAVDGSASRRRNQTACEACRATKIRCQPSEQPGVCRKCLESKRECISRTGPRTRRSRRAKTSPDGMLVQATTQSSPATGPNATSSTFSIDFAVPAPDDVDEDFGTLRETHKHMMERILPPEDEDDEFGISSALAPHLGSFPTPPATSSTPSHSIESLQGKPQFNLSSAESLLTSFRSMLPNYPCIILPEDATVTQLAATRPFVLLAILAAASGSRTLQGHTLYDEEFRKVLGLKFVASGERTLELLQGILIYCAWYPFHLRPKNKQVFHYIRMAADLIHDLELDQEPPEGFVLGSELSDDKLSGIRAYLSFAYFVRGFAVAWRKHRNLIISFTHWTAVCCEALERSAQGNGDLTLVALVHLSGIVSDASDAFHSRHDRTEHESRLLLLGLEAQARELRQHIPPPVAATTSGRFALLFTDLYLNGGCLLALPRSRHNHSSPGPLSPSPSKIAAILPSLKLYLSETLRLDQPAFLAFTSADWAHLVLAIILAFRLSLPLPECPAFDHVSARDELRLGDFLDAMCRETDLAAASKKVDVLSASRVVFRIVKAKFDRHVGLANMREDAAAAVTSSSSASFTPATARSAAAGICPMLDGSVDQYLPLWDPAFPAMDTAVGPTPPGVSGGATASKLQQPVFHDLWATMTMGWARDG